MCEYAGDNGPTDCSNKSSKWVQSSNAVKAFIESPDSRGIKASVIMFPFDDGNDLCTTSEYTTAITPEVTLPDSTTLPPAIDKHIAVDGGTPTMNALAGTITYAQSIVTATSGKEKVANVIATDGIPDGCDDTGTITPAANEAKEVSSTIPTYVIGVGDQTGSLDSLAQSGGTARAFTASTSTPSQTGSQLAAALATIRAASMLARAFAISSKQTRIRR